MFSAPRTAPLPPDSSTPTTQRPEDAERDLPRPPSPQSAGAEEEERHIDVCDYCRSMQRRTRSRSRSQHRDRHRCVHRRSPSVSNVPVTSARDIERSQEDDSEQSTPSTVRAASPRALRSASALPRTLLASAQNTPRSGTPRNDSSLPPYASRPPSESGRHDRAREMHGRSRSNTVGTMNAPRVPESTLAFVRDQQQRQYAQQSRIASVEPELGEDLGEVPLARVPPAADPLRVHFVPSRESATMTSSGPSSHPRHHSNLLRVPTRQESGEGQAHDSAQSIVAQMRLQERDERLGALLEDCVRDSRQPSAPVTFQKVSNGSGRNGERTSHTPKKHRKPSSLLDSVLGFDEVNPQDLIYGEGSKVDGGFAYALPDQYREGSILLDSEQPLAQEEPQQSNSTPSYFSSTLTSYFRRDGGRSSSQEERSRNFRHLASNAAAGRDSIESTTSSIFSFGRHRARPTTLSDRVNRSNIRPRELKLSKEKRSERKLSKLRESKESGEEQSQCTWEDVQLRPSTAGGKNAKLAEALGVDRPATASATLPPRHSEDLTTIREESTRELAPAHDEKEGRNRNSRFQSGGTNPASLTKRKTDSFVRDSRYSNPAGMSEADIVAICLVQGMVPPGLPRDDTLVTWSGPLSPTNPRNWPAFHKWYACIFVALATFLANAGTNMVAPALGLVSDSFHEVYIPSYRGFLIGSYVLAFAFAPLIYGPLSELFGRKPVLVFGTSLFWIANLLCGFVDASWELMILRFLAALGASAPMAIGGAVLTDIFSPDKRGRAMTVFALAPQLGPVLGPIMGGWVAQETRDWRIIFWVAACAGFFVAFFVFFMRESYTPRILARRAKRLRKKTGNPALTTIFERRQESVRQVLTRGMIRPLVLFCCEPIVQLLCLYVSLIYGVMHLVTATFPAVFGTIYEEYPGWASMHFIGIGVGTIAGGILGGHLIERHYRRLSRRNKGVGKPEYKIHSFLYSVWLPPLGLLLYGLVTYYGVHWIFADAGIVLFCLGISMAIVAIQSYIVDCYALLAGSALTSTIVFRSIVGTGATIAAEDVLLEGGMLWSNVAIATACVVIGVPIAFIIYFCGARLRHRSRHATHKR